jgi:hypothetical protein
VITQTSHVKTLILVDEDLGRSEALRSGGSWSPPLPVTAGGPIVD